MDLAKIKPKLFFTVSDVAEASGLSMASAHVLCSRYTQKSIFLRLKRNFYVLSDNWERYNSLDFVKIANFLQVPSYASCTTALAFHGLTTQVQHNWFDCIATQRTTRMEIHGAIFNYHKFQQGLYFGFERQNDIFIALPEKAALDAAYLEARSGYSADWSALDLAALDQKRINEWLTPFPQHFKRKIMEKCMI